MNNTRIVRLQNGCDIIASVDEIVEGQYMLNSPMEFEIQHNRAGTAHIVMQNFLPENLVKKNEVMLDKKDIVFITVPSDDFTEYYETQVLEKAESEKEKDISKYDEQLQEEMTNRAMQIMLEAFEQLNPEEPVFH